MKRERFVFRPNHLRVLEESYKSDAYPDNIKREYIVDECNRAYEHEGELQVEVGLLVKHMISFISTFTQSVLT